MYWWQTGMLAIAANIVVDCGQDAPAQQMLALAERMAQARAPAGWLVWPDQNPERQQPLLLRCGFRPCEQLWLASLAVRSLSSRDKLAANFNNELHCGPVAAAQIDELILFYQCCHLIPISFARVVANAFCAESNLVCGSTSHLLDGLRLKTFGLWNADRLVATITAIMLNSSNSQLSEVFGGLLWLGTHPAWRCRGLARQLTSHACGWLAHQGVEHVHVQASAAAIPLYRSLGFVERGWLELWASGP
ncbi:GNAT family N-acetyltransferase [Cyanobium sp. HWJ4-Hawea]|uniref:GNAT family N-acetyltransferase n=1 Tax=Cyanobium sp. HWJ4-Hawea TaxID=2823713 RepID=UPI0020CE1EB1|nr:GNAT family N-acetyltransferase [Cyanobium sp. HWJ4-Hawea]MCP9808631.1 GNAT family N-acetyltransferase [Cyanobium sp. HWJ4-Hawea]